MSVFSTHTVQTSECQTRHDILILTDRAAVHIRQAGSA